MVPPIVFLQNKLSLDEYANHMCQESNYGETMNKGVIYDIIVADINAKSMVHIYKKDTTKTKYAEKKKVDFGVHTLSSQSRFDSGSFKDICMKSLFSKMIRDYKKEQVLPLEKMAKEFVFDPAKADFDIAGCSWIPDKEDQFRAMSTIAMEVKPNKKKECSMKGMWTKMAIGKRISSLSR
ncbi:unnamed protein product [Arabis nemorensis]|uniref:Uncharacterized protein n=1 Tax=Arabis nemorensis TaxID=586526 RepID=A0A565BYY2_9BRAS|nr:unnamed protein product [Arabis nemorensis]